MNEVIKMLEGYVAGRENTEKVGISVLQLNRMLKVLKDDQGKETEDDRK